MDLFSYLSLFRKQDFLRLGRMICSENSKTRCLGCYVVICPLLFFSLLSRTTVNWTCFKASKSRVLRFHGQSDSANFFVLFIRFNDDFQSLDMRMRHAFLILK